MKLVRRSQIDGSDVAVSVCAFGGRPAFAMARKLIRQTRDRYLTPEEGAKYQRIREQVEGEKAEIAAEFRARLTAISTAQQVFSQLKQVREAKGLSLRDVQELTGIDASALSKLERGERENFTVDTIIRYARAVGRQVAISISEAG